MCGTDGETLEALADKSLLEVAGGRYRMLETIRAYGAERLDAAGERESVRRAHAQRLLELLRTADPHLRRAEQLEWLPVVAAEHGDLLAALRWAVEEPAVETAFELLAAAFNYLWIRGASASVAPLAIALLASVGEAAPTGSARSTRRACCSPARRRPLAKPGSRCGSGTVRRPARRWRPRGPATGRAATRSSCCCG
ncbi:hypothetical protein PQR15_35600 [Streptomyces lydicus]|nr:hypothetical protein [Streptomyces lydicus]